MIPSVSTHRPALKVSGAGRAVPSTHTEDEDEDKENQDPDDEDQDDEDQEDDDQDDEDQEDEDQEDQEDEDPEEEPADGVARDPGHMGNVCQQFSSKLQKKLQVGCQ